MAQASQNTFLHDVKKFRQSVNKRRTRFAICQKFGSLRARSRNRNFRKQRFFNLIGRMAQTEVNMTYIVVV